MANVVITNGEVQVQADKLVTEVSEGSVDPKRAAALIQLALQKVPEPRDEGSSYGTYVLEHHWSWDNAHYEFITIGLEKGDSEIPFEELLSVDASEAAKGSLLEFLKAKMPNGSHTMVRLYRVLSRQYVGYSPNIGIGGTLTSDTVDLHFVLKPLFDFDDKGNPTPCAIA